MGLSRNIPLFIAFRVLFNARFYYPVIGVLFLDLGLSLEEYALLNVGWAVAIVLLEVPSGALADVVGRRRMVQLAAVLMVAEMAIFAFAPKDQPGLLFWLLLLNRVLSGAAEAAASGADEALAYDSLPLEGRQDAWPRVLVSLMRWQSGAFFFAMIAGSLLYDPEFIRTVVGWLGGSWAPTAADVMRWPVYLTLGTSFLCLGVAAALRDPLTQTRPDTPPVGQALRNIRAGARAVVTDRRILLVLLAALSCDSIVRVFFSIESNYLRIIQIPEYLFGLIGASLGVFGFLTAPVARHLVEKKSPTLNFTLVSLLVFLGLSGLAFMTPLIGVWVIIPLGFAMSGLSFFLSHYLNLWAPSEIRATVLSFRGMIMNVAYGTAGLFYAGLTARLRSAAPEAPEQSILGQSLAWFPWVFILSIGVVAAFALISRQSGKVGFYSKE